MLIENINPLLIAEVSVQKFHRYHKPLRWYTAYNNRMKRLHPYTYSFYTEKPGWRLWVIDRPTVFFTSAGKNILWEKEYSSTAKAQRAAAEYREQLSTFIGKLVTGVKDAN